MKQLKYFSAFFMTLALLVSMGCASTSTREGTGEYIDDTVITNKVKAAIINDPTLKATEINVETFKGVVQLSGFVASQADIDYGRFYFSSDYGVIDVLTCSLAR